MKVMTSRERIQAAIAGQPVDKIPVSPRIWRYAMWKKIDEIELAHRLNIDLISFAGSPLWDGLRCMTKEDVERFSLPIKVDISKQREREKTLIYRTFHTPGGKLHDCLVQPDPGGEYGINPNPERLEPLVKTNQDVDRLSYLLPDPALIAENFLSVRDYEARMRDRGIVAYRPTLGPDHLTLEALGVERALTACLEEPELFDRVLNTFEKWHVAVMRQILEGGWKIIFDSWYNFSLSVGWSPAFYRDKVAPLIHHHAELAHRYGAKLFVYDDGRLAQSIGMMIDAGADIIQTLTPPPGGDLDFLQLAKQYGGRACFNGGVDTVRIRFGGPDEIEKNVRTVLDILGPTKKFILGTSDSLTEGTPDKNIEAFFSAADRYGREVARKVYG